MMEQVRAHDALLAIPADVSRDEWVRALMAAHAAGLSQEDAEEWSSQAPSFNRRDFQHTWRSIKPGRGIGPGTLFDMASRHGWRPREGGPAQRPSLGGRHAPAAAPTAGQVFDRFTPAPADHPYIAGKQGMPDGLRVVPAGDPLRIAGQSMAGCLAIPCHRADGTVSTIQFVPAPGQGKKLNLPGHAFDGWFTVGQVAPGAAVYLCEGIGQAWACWKATGRAAVVCFGWGRVRTVAVQLRERQPETTLVVVPDVGKEDDAEKLATDLGLQWVRMPAGWPQNADVNDLGQRDGFDALEALLAAPIRPVRNEPRQLDFRALAGQHPPRRHWFIPGWLSGPTLVAAAGGMGKSSLLQHLATTGALGRGYFAQQEEPFRSLMWTCEDDHDEVWRRQARICAHEQVDMASLDGRLHVVSRVGCDNALMVVVQGQLCATPLMKQLREQVNDLRADMLVLDNVAHLFLGDHDDRTHATAFINAICGLVSGRPFAPVLVAHVSRAQGSEFTGSVAWENAVRMRWFLGNRLPDQAPEPGEDESDRSAVRFLCKRKSNYSAQDFVRFTMQEGLLVPDHQPQDGPSGIVRVLDEKRAEEVCLAGFKSLKAMGLHPSDSKASGDYLPRQILEKRLASGYGKSDLAKAMNRLMSAGVFARGEVSKYPNRTPRMGLVLTEGEA